MLPWSARAQYVDTAASCLLCHQTTLPQNDFCALVPAAIWAKSDKHNGAFRLLHDSDPPDPKQAQAKRELVRRILGFELGEAFTKDDYSRLKADGDAETAAKVATVKACLRCHATWPVEADERYPYTPPVPLALGVSCQVCHGPGERWDQPHRLAAWRAVTPAAKALLDCADVRSPVHKAQLCVSCHVGNFAQQRFVRHEWYAAGHPPLPSFELASFEAQMPMHWKSLREKGTFEFRDARPRDEGGRIDGQIATLVRSGIPAEAIKRSYREANFPGAAASGLDPTSDLPRARDATVGGIVAMEMYVRVVGDYAALAAENKAPWPELALYDCAACHHELRSGLGLRLRPERRNTPGRPPLAVWPTVLARLGAQQAAGYGPGQAAARWAPIELQLRQLEQATTVRPFGDPASMQGAALALAESLDQLATSATDKPYDKAAAKKAIAFLTDPSQYEIRDYATARQAAWAIRELALDLGSIEADSLFLRGPEDVLTLTLPSGQERSVIENLSRWLPAAARYDAEWFQEDLKSVRMKLSGP